jgi:hypothetical protein
MITHIPMVSAYLPQDIAKCFIAFKAAKGLSDAAAIVEILRSYFGLTEESEESGLSLVARIERLEKLCSVLKED